MRIVIIGSGKVGYNLAENLSKENDVTIIDSDCNALERPEEMLDVMCIKGSGLSINILKEASIDKSDLLIAVTSSDEINMVCCLMGKKLGAKQTVARIRDREYAKELVMLKDRLELDMVINPERAAAEEIVRSLSYSKAITIGCFANDKVKLLQIRMTENMPLVNTKIENIGSIYRGSVLIVAVVRMGEVYIPDGQFTILKDDIIYFIGRSQDIIKICMQFSNHKIKNIMIAGGCRIAAYVSEFLKDMNMNVKIIENDPEKCKILKETIPEAEVICGDGTDEDFLRSENISDMDVFIAMTGMDEENLMAALVAKQYGIPKTIIKISRMNYVNITRNMGIDNIICPKLITTNEIIKYIRGTESLQSISDGRVEIVELIAGVSFRGLYVRIKNLSISDRIKIVTIVRDKAVVIPNGNDTIELNDRVVIVAKDIKINNMNDIITYAGGISGEIHNGIKRLEDYFSI